MKKIIMSTIALLLLVSTSVFAQTKGKSDKDIANKLCDCIEKSFAQYPPIMREMLIDMGELGEEKAKEKFDAKLAKISPKEKMKIEKAMETSPDVALEKNCGEAGKIMNGKSDAASKKIFAQMKNMKNCKLATALMKASMKE